MRIAMLTIVLAVLTGPLSAQTIGQDGTATYYTSNPYLGASVSATDPRVSPYSSYGAQNSYTMGGGPIYAKDGTYLGRLNANRYDSESVANPYGKYGSQYSSSSINNPYSTYGSPYSAQSATNPYTSTPPIVIYDGR
jgi:hypothetical protein